MEGLQCRNEGAPFFASFAKSGIPQTSTSLAFSLYIDDRGSAAGHRFAIAAGMVFPAKRIEAFERGWKALLKKEGATADLVASLVHDYSLNTNTGMRLVLDHADSRWT
jgi:hypothetical protein